MLRLFFFVPLIFLTALKCYADTPPLADFTDNTFIELDLELEYVVLESSNGSEIIELRKDGMLVGFLFRAGRVLFSAFKWGKRARKVSKAAGAARTVGGASRARSAAVTRNLSAINRSSKVASRSLGGIKKLNNKPSYNVAVKPMRVNGNRYLVKIKKKRKRRSGQNEYDIEINTQTKEDAQALKRIFDDIKKAYDTYSDIQDVLSFFEEEHHGYNWDIVYKYSEISPDDGWIYMNDAYGLSNIEISPDRILNYCGYDANGHRYCRRTPIADMAGIEVKKKSKLSFSLFYSAQHAPSFETQGLSRNEGAKIVEVSLRSLFDLGFDIGLGNFKVGFGYMTTSTKGILNIENARYSTEMYGASISIGMLFQKVNPELKVFYLRDRYGYSTYMDVKGTSLSLYFPISKDRKWQLGLTGSGYTYNSNGLFDGIFLVPDKVGVKVFDFEDLRMSVGGSIRYTF